MKISSKDSRRQAILDAATEILALKPTATLQEIADYSDIGIATLHRHFSSREMLLDELALNAIDLVKKALAKIAFDYSDIKSSLMDIFDALIPLGNKIYFLGTAASVDENPNVVSGESSIKQPILYAIEQWKKNGLLNKNISSKWMMAVMYNLLFVAWQEIQSGNIARNDASNFLLITILQGFSQHNES